MKGLMANGTAKEAAKRPMVDMDISVSRKKIKSIIQHKMKERCQKPWEEERKGRGFTKSKGKQEKLEAHTGQERGDNYILT